MHRPVLAVAREGEHVYGMTEDGAEVFNLTKFARKSDPHVWVCVDPAWLLLHMLESFKDDPEFNYQIVQSSEVECDGAYMENSARLTRFGWSTKRTQRGGGTGGNGRRHRGMHTVWSLGDMSRNPSDLADNFDHAGLLKFGCDVRDWCREYNVPLPTSLSGIAASLLRDSRFWSDGRGRVPTSTNERVRAWLPGVYSELRADPGTSHHAVAIDQRTAYHRAAQEVATPDPTTLFARGYFNEPDTSPIWAPRDSEVYARTMAQPGVVFVTYSARPLRKHETRPPAIKPGEGRCALWTNEVEHAERMGVTIHGIVAAWTSCDPDPGLPLYGKWAQERIMEADAYRKRWLKPTLHAVYGLLAMRPRQVHIAHHRGNGKRGVVVLGGGHEFIVHRHELPVLPSPTTNVAMLGVLQAEIRTRSLKMATALSMEGATVLHIHADGIHVEGKLPLIDNTWSVEPRSNLMYIDRVSWLSDEGDTLPGRDERERVQLRRHHVHIFKQSLRAHRSGAPHRG